MPALRGNLVDFGIAEVFQLIAQQRKTGFLEIQNEGERVRLAFEAGAVVQAEPVSDREDGALADLLLRCGLVTRERLLELEREMASSLRRLGAVALERGFLDRDQLGEMEDLLTRETLFRLLRWSDGSFVFNAAPVEHDRAGRLLAAEQILMDGLRMVDEWRTFASQVPSEDSVFQRVGRFEAAAGVREGGRRREDARRVFQLIDGRLPVRRVIDLSRLGTFEATRILAELRRAGLIEPLAPEQVARQRPRPSLELRRPPSRPLLAGALPVALLLALAVCTRRAPEPPLPEGLFPIPRTALLEARAAFETERVRKALEAYQFSYERWPESLETLVEVGLLTREALAPSGGRPYYYARREDGAVLLAPEH